MACGLKQGRLSRGRFENPLRRESVRREIGLEHCCRLASVVAIAIVALALHRRRMAVTDIIWWHAMSGELGKQLEKLAADFNASQSEYRIVPTYKGNYTETVTAAIFAFRSRSQPAIVQVNEIATATMMAAQGRDLSGVRIDARPEGGVFAERLSAGRDRLLFRRRRQHAVVPVQRLDADPLLQQGHVPRRRPRSGSARRKPGPRSALPRSGCARRARPAASPRPGRPGSMSRISPPSTICRSRPAPTALAGSMRN